MSDSYTTWCEEQERNARRFSHEHIKNIKQTRKFKSNLTHAVTLCESANLKTAKSCKNCARKWWLNSENICPKLGIILHETDNVCDFWKGKIRTAKRIPNEDVIAWYLLSKSKNF